MSTVYQINTLTHKISIRIHNDSWSRTRGHTIEELMGILHFPAWGDNRGELLKKLLIYNTLKRKVINNNIVSHL